MERTVRSVENMAKQKVFTIFNDDDTVYGYIFDVTRVEMQKAVEELNEKTKEHHYYMDGYYDCSKKTGC